MYSHLRFFIICLVGFLDHLSIGLVAPIFAVMLFDPNVALLSGDTSAEARGALFGLLVGITPCAQFFSSSILGSYSDRRGRRFVLMIGIGLGVIGYLFAYLGVSLASMALLMLYRVLVGASDGTVAVAQAAVADMSDEETKARKFSLFHGVLGFGFTIGPFVGGILAAVAYETPFIITGLLSLINLFLVWRFFPETYSAKESAEEHSVWEGVFNLKKAFSWKNLRSYFAACFAFSFGWAFFAEFVPLLLMDKYAATTVEIGYYFAYMGIWYSISSAILTAPLTKRYPAEYLAIAALLLTALFMPVFLLVESPWQFALYAPPLMLLMALIFPNLAALVSNKVSADVQGQVSGIYQSVSAAAFGLSPILGGSIIGSNPHFCVWGGAFFFLIAGSICLARHFVKVPVETAI